MTHKAELPPPDEHELDTYRKREGRHEVIRYTIVIVGVLLLAGVAWERSGVVNDSSDQFVYCQKAENRAKPYCDEPVAVSGEEGPPGQRGPRGFLGITGRDGADGRDGRDGKDGATGHRGLRGFPGADSTVPGPQGPAGADSTVPGPPGQDGSNGSDGAPGPACPDGYSPQLRTVPTVENGPEVVSVCIED